MFLRLAAASCVLGSALFGDTLILRSGATIQGSYAGGDTRNIRFMVGDHLETYQLNEVQRLDFTGGNGGYTGATAVTQSSPRYDAPSELPRTTDRDRYNPDRDANRNDRPAPPAPLTGSGLEVPSGTNLVVKLIDNVDSQVDSVGKTYRASIDEPVMLNGQTILPRGADVVVKLVNEAESGRFTGRASLTLDLVSIQLNGRMVDIQTSEVTQASRNRTNRTGATVGGGALVGAIFGGVFGGGKGAAVGALTGGALGAGAQVMTKGERVKIPSETRLSFLLQQPLRV